MQIGAALFTGLLFGAFRLNENADTQLDFEVNSKLVELGNNLVLFFAGLSCEPDFFYEYFRAVTILAMGYFIMATALFAHTFSKVSTTAIGYSEYTRALSFERAGSSDGGPVYAWG